MVDEVKKKVEAPAPEAPKLKLRHADENGVVNLKRPHNRRGGKASRGAHFAPKGT